jgi:hypothetical protein
MLEDSRETQVVQFESMHGYSSGSRDRVLFSMFVTPRVVCFFGVLINKTMA